MNIQSGELLHAVSACVISKMRCIKSVEMGGGLFFDPPMYILLALCCAVLVVIMGFYLFPRHMDEGFHSSFVSSHTISSCFFAQCKDTSLTSHSLAPLFHLFLSQYCRSHPSFLSASFSAPLPHVYILPDPKQQN